MSIQFGPFTLDLETRQLLRSGRDVHLTPKAFDLLATLALSRPSAQSKQVLHARLWTDTFVAEANLSNLVGEIRAALDDRDRVATWIRTVHGFGYAFCGEAIAVPARASRPLPIPSAGSRGATVAFRCRSANTSSAGIPTSISRSTSPRCRGGTPGCS